MKRIGLLPIAFIAMLAVACGGNTARDNEGAVGTAGVDRGDQKFAEELMASNMAEVELGKLGIDRASNPEVKRFAQMVVRDHTQALEQLKQMAEGHVTAPAQLPDDARDTIDRLSKLRGNEFDREFIDVMVEKHEDTVDKLENRVDNGRAEKDDDHLGARVNQFAAKVLPTVRRHLEEAKRIDAMLGKRTTERY